MWFKLANLTLGVGQHLGSMDSISKSYRIDYNLTGLNGSHTSTSFSTEGQSISVTFTFTVKAGYEFKSGSTITCGGSTLFTAGQDYAAGSTFTATKSISASVSIVGTASAVTPDIPDTPDPEEPDVPVNPPSGDSNYTLIHGNKYSSGFEDNTARASISPLTITVPNGVTITNKSTIKWAYYTNVNTNNMPSGTGSGTWGDYKYTGTGAAIGISFKKADDSAFDWSVDSNNPADYFDVSDPGLWNGTAQGTTPEPEEPDEPEGAEGTLDINAFNAMTLAFGNPFGTAAQQSDPARVHSEVNLYAPAGTVISLIDNTNYKWALKKMQGATGKASDSTFNNGGYVPESAWSAKKSYTTTVNGYWKFVLLKASNAAFDWSTDSQKVSDYFTVS